MLRALYGHPEAGGHWEKHLTKVIVGMGGYDIPNHPSCFWFADRRLFLIVYVDDLLLAGPEAEHKAFWDEISTKVKLEPWEDLDRYLGRHHDIQPCSRLDYDLMEWFKSPVAV